MAGRLDMVKPVGHGRREGGPQVGLALGRDLIRGQIGPALLEAHPTKGQHRHRQFAAAKPPGRKHQWGSRLGKVRRLRTGVGKPRGCSSCCRVCSCSSGSSS